LQLKHDTPDAAADYGSGAVQSAMPRASHSAGIDNRAIAPLWMKLFRFARNDGGGTRA
jgi:hypothetical protein